MKLVISDTSPLRALHFLSLLDLLPQLFERVVITPAVQAELEQPLRRIFSPVLVSALPFVELRAPSDPVLVAELRKTLDLGEAEAIAMAIELKATVLIDEVRGRAEAERRGLVLTGVLGVLLQAKGGSRLASRAAHRFIEVGAELPGERPSSIHGAAACR